MVEEDQPTDFGRIAGQPKAMRLLERISPVSRLLANNRLVPPGAFLDAKLLLTFISV